MTCGIYKITCKETGRCYIGQSINIETRLKQHRARRGKFPASAFDYEILMACDVDYLNFFEKAFIFGYDSHKNGFNKTLGGTDIKSTHHDAETRRLISEARRGKPLLEETKQLISEKLTGKPKSEEHRQNISKCQTGKPQPKSQCVHCGIWCAAGTMARFHGDKCFALTGLPSPSKGKPAHNKGKKTGPAPKSQCPYCYGWFAANTMAQWHGDNCKHKKEIEND